MQLSDWVISISAAGVSICLGIAGYFANMWFSGVNETLQKHSEKTDKLETKIDTVKEEIQKSRAEVPARTAGLVASENSRANSELTRRVVESADKMEALKIILQTKVLPKMEQISHLNEKIEKVAEDQFHSSGKVIVLEETVERFVQGLQNLKNRKP